MVGMLYGLVRGDTARATVMNSIAPVWDGNETWLIFGGLGLLTAFPLAFAIIIPAVYFPILMMLLARVGCAGPDRRRRLYRLRLGDYTERAGPGAGARAKPPNR
jgi:cytochrome bd ubiquinol oxidase subunit II